MLPETLKHYLLIVSVMDWDVFDVICLLGIVQGLNGLFIVHITWGDTGNHEAVRIPAQTLLQDRRELALSVWHMLLNTLMITC